MRTNTDRPEQILEPEKRYPDRNQHWIIVFVEDDIIYDIQNYFAMCPSMFCNMV